MEPDFPREPRCLPPTLDADTADLSAPESIRVTLQHRVNGAYGKVTQALLGLYPFLELEVPGLCAHFCLKYLCANKGGARGASEVT